MDSVENLRKDIRRLAHKTGAVILAHNYQPLDVQEVADYIGDSFGLCKQAQLLETEVILFCGVYFMAETAAILNPNKRVLIPDPTARCPMAAQLPAQLVREAKARYPGVPIVLYVNTTAEAKAEADVLCTSSNLCQILEALDSDQILFGPDENMAIYAQKICGQQIIPIPEHGFCPVHITFTFDSHILQLRQRNPNALLLVHPECDWDIQAQADFIGSTGQMLRYAQESSATTFLIATEIDLITRLSREMPEKTFLPVLPYARCYNMKKHTLHKIKASLLEDKFTVTVPESIARRASKAIERMLDLTQLI